MSKVKCNICPHECNINESGIGFCKARGNVNGTIKAINYGYITSLSLDPIEKKPLYHFHPGSLILSVGSFGCNLRCLHCQNYGISMCGKSDADYEYIEPEKLVAYACSTRHRGNIGIAYTYNEPLVGYEFVRDCSRLAKKNGLLNVLVTNGYVCKKPLLDILPYIDALNIDLKAFTDEFYKKVNGDIETVKESIKVAAECSHVEVSTLIIPGENDSENEIEELAKWLKSVNPDIPLHLSRFFPRYKLINKNPTDVGLVYRLADIARRYLKYVYEGNC